MRVPLRVAAVMAVATIAPSSSAPDSVRELEAVLRPWRVVHVGAATDGIIDEVRVERGDRVAADQVVATLDFSVEEAKARLDHARASDRTEIEMAEARLIDAQRRLERQSKLRDEGIVTAEELDTLKTTVQLAEIAVRQAGATVQVARLEYDRTAAMLERSRLASPVAGVVTERYLSRGELISRSGTDRVVTVAELDPLRVEVHVPLSMHPFVNLGDTARVARRDVPDQELVATVSVIDSLVDTASDTFRVTLTLPNPDYAIPAGLRCGVRFTP